MTTLEKKTTRPKIFTESDKILGDLKDELSTLSQRVMQLEHEQENSREVFDQFLLQKNVFSESLDKHKEEKDLTQENFEVLAGVMHKLKSPVSSVVNNLSGIVEEIQDEETQETLRECMEAAGSVLASFNEIEDFCEEASHKEGEYQVQLLNSKEYFNETFKKSLLTVGGNTKHKCSLKINENIPEKVLLKSKVIDTILKSLALEIQGYSNPTKIAFDVSVRTGKEIYGCQFKELVISVEGDAPSKLNWAATMKDTITTNDEEFDNLGLVWLQMREKLWKSGGDLEILQKEQKISGFNISFPLVDA